MRRLSLASLLLLALACLATPRTASAQINSLDDIVRGGVDDARLLTNAYLDPGVDGFGAGLNTGWAGAARPHKLFGFHLRAGVTVVSIPGGDQDFSVTEGDFNILAFADGAVPASSPTVGGDDDAATYRFVVPGLQSGFGSPEDPIVMPQGTGISYVPAPVLEAGVGLIRDTEVMLRLVPTINVDEYGDVGLFGLGLKHGLNQWIPAGGVVPVDLSVMAHYTRLNVTANLSEGGDRQLDWTSNAFAVNVLAGKTVSVLSVYGGVGFERATTDVAFKGTYTLEVETPQGTQTVTETDPEGLSVDFTGANNVRALAGLRLRLAVLALYVEGTLANYPSLMAGVGLSFR
jgi:hypothetical protein